MKKQPAINRLLLFVYIEALDLRIISKRDIIFFRNDRNTFFHPVYKGQKTKNKNNCSPAEQVKKERMIKMTKELENKKVNLDAMENVNGGTVKEFEELVTTMAPTGILKGFGKISAHLPIGNEKSAEIVESVLKGVGIEAHIDLGWAGTGIGSGNNIYVNMNTGERMTHQEVLGIVKNIKVA